jgi:hypothetical protein
MLCFEEMLRRTLEGTLLPTTVAATLVATSYPVYCQYVDTHAPYNVFGYDFKYTDPTKIS